MVQMAESVALYWDFENLHAGLVDEAEGPGSYAANRFRPQNEIIDSVLKYGERPASMRC